MQEGAWEKSKIASNLGCKQIENVQANHGCKPVGVKRSGVSPLFSQDTFQTLFGGMEVVGVVDVLL